MSDTAIFVCGCVVTLMLLLGVLFSMREVKRLYDEESSSGDGPPPGEGPLRSPPPDA